MFSLQEGYGRAERHRDDVRTVGYICRALDTVVILYHQNHLPSAISYQLQSSIPQNPLDPTPEISYQFL